MMKLHIANPEYLIDINDLAGFEPAQTPCGTSDLAQPARGDAGLSAAAGSMAAALRYCDAFLPGNSLVALKDLLDALAAV